MGLEVLSIEDLLVEDISTIPKRISLKDISVNPKIVWKIVTDLDSCEASGPDCIPVMVLKNCAPELPYILTGLF